MSKFDDIRPYSDAELPAALTRVVADDECINLIAKIRFPTLFGSLGWLLRPLLRWQLMRKVSSIKSVYDFQLVVERYLSSMLDSSSEGVTVSGLEHFDIATPHLFISNHRDITLDPALTNYALHLNGGTTTRIAIGDNLLSKPFAADLMRANKSFIVKRSLSGPRELLKALRTLSDYIWHSLKVDKENVWIAHREGRAKDGLDKTEPAVIKMLTIAKPKTESFAQYIRDLNIIPVSVSYEYDPCDAMKAAELRAIEQQGEYVKAEHEDMESIGKGIVGNKGTIYLTFGQALQGEFDSPEAVAAALDRAIVANYRIQPPNVLAYELLHGAEQLQSLRDRGFLSEQECQYADQDREAFHQRMAAMPDADTPFALAIYANPIVNRSLVLGENVHDLGEVATR